MRLVRVPGGWADRDVDLAALGWSNLLGDTRAVAAYTIEGRLLTFNDAMQELVGWSVEEVDRRGWIACLYPDADEQAATLHNAVVLAGPGAIPRRHSRSITREDGSHIVLDLLSSGFALPDGTRGVFATA